MGLVTCLRKKRTTDLSESDDISDCPGVSFLKRMRIILLKVCIFIEKLCT